jgi:hypothetical protein
MKNLKTIAILLFTIVLVSNSYSQKGNGKVTIKSITDGRREYVIKNGKIVSVAGKKTSTYTYNKRGLLETPDKIRYYIYNPDGTLGAFRFKLPFPDNEYNYSYLIIYTYQKNNINQKKYKSTNLSNIIEEYNYSIKNGLIVSKSKVGATDESTYQYDSNGNMTYNRGDVNDKNGISFYEYNITYDNQPSIELLKSINLYGNSAKWTKILLGEFGAEISPNKPLMSTFKSTHTNVILSYTYTYAPNGYPSSVITTNASGKITTTKYTY